MSKKGLKVPFAYDEGRLIRPTQATPKTPYRCTGCENEVRLRRGSTCRDHFYHKPGLVQCNWVGESDTHRLAKYEVACRLNDDRQYPLTTRCFKSHPGHPYPIDIMMGEGDKALVEVAYGSRRLDVGIVNAEGEIVYGIEIYHKHEVCDRKASDLSGIPWVEIDADSVIKGQPLLTQMRGDTSDCIVCAERAAQRLAEALARAEEEAARARTRAKEKAAVEAALDAALGVLDEDEQAEEEGEHKAALEGALDAIGEDEQKPAVKQNMTFGQCDDLIERTTAMEKWVVREFLDYVSARLRKKAGAIADVLRLKYPHPFNGTPTKPRVLKARFASKCSICDVFIERGEKIARYQYLPKNVRTMHIKCVDLYSECVALGKIISRRERDTEITSFVGLIDRREDDAELIKAFIAFLRGHPKFLPVIPTIIVKLENIHKSRPRVLD